MVKFVFAVPTGPVIRESRECSSDWNDTRKSLPPGATISWELRHHRWGADPWRPPPGWGHQLYCQHHGEVPLTYILVLLLYCLNKNSCDGPFSIWFWQFILTCSTYNEKPSRLSFYMSSSYLIIISLVMR